MNICEHLTATAKLFPDKEAIVFEGRRFTFAELDSMSRSVAGLLAESGVAQGDRVAIMMPNVPAFVVWYYATLRIGAIAVSISTRLAASEVSFLVEDCQARIFVALAETLDKLKSDLPACVANRYASSDLGDLCNGEPLAQPSPASEKWIDAAPDDPALILYTSGTTGFAKGATLSHMNVRSNVHAFNHLCNMQSKDRILLAVPLFHCFGQNALLNSALNVGATLVLQRKFDPSEAKQLIAEESVTQLYGVPMMFQLFQDSFQPAELSTVTYCFSAAATLPIQVGQRWQEKFGLPIHEGYGLTETSPFASYNHRNKFIPGSIGTPIDCVEMKIVDTETGATCAPGELGEIAIRGPNVMLGYWNRPDDTSAAIKGGWFHSGDIGRIDETGFFYIVDRVKDMISVGGQKVYPAEVERVLLDHSDVSQCAVVGIPDDVFGEKVVAFLVAGASGKAADDQLNASVQKLASENLANYKVPREFVVIDELPRNPSGKILKTKLREMDIAGVNLGVSEQSEESSADSAIVSSAKLRPPTLRKQLQSAFAADQPKVSLNFVQGLVQSITGSEERPESDTRFLDAGFDSLMVVEMSSQIQVELGPENEVPATLVFDYPRLSDLADFLLKTVSADKAADKSKTQLQPHGNAFQKLTDVSQPNSTTGQEVASMSEEQALEELMKELEA